MNFPSEIGEAELTFVPIADLSLDPFNPRFAGDTFAIDDQEAMLRRLWLEYNVGEIVGSIVSSASFSVLDPLIVTSEHGRLLVIKGNRRLAAARLLHSPSLKARIGASGIPRVDPELRVALSRLPVIYRTRREAWHSIAFNSLNGPQEWDSMAKAEYIARIHEEYDVPLGEIANTIGDRNDTVQRLYHGLKVLQQAESAGVFDPAQRFYRRKRFAYSHLWAGLGYDGIRSYLGLTDSSRDKREPVAKNKITNLGRVCQWLYGNHETGTEPHVKSQNPNLRQLDEALRTSRGIAALEAGLSLDDSVNASRGDTRLLLDALISAEQNLRDAKGYFSTGFRGQGEVQETVVKIYTLAEGLRHELDSVKARRR